jgi:hypothetical protein
MHLQRFVHLSRLAWQRIVSETRCAPTRIKASIANARVAEGYYKFIGKDELAEKKRGDTLFVLGSGGSLAFLPNVIIEEMEKNSTISFNYSLLQDFVRADFHLVRELGVTNIKSVNLGNSDLRNLHDLIAKNPRYGETVFLAQGGYNAWSANFLIGSRGLPKGATVFRFRNPYVTRFGKLGTRLDAVTHGASSVTDCINIGYILGFKKIVLCGLDLYDRRYFWNMPGAKYFPLPGITDAEIGEYGGKGEVTAPHRTSDRLVGQIAQWRQELEEQGVTLSVQNPKSLLTAVLPVYSAPVNG